MWVWSCKEQAKLLMRLAVGQVPNPDRGGRANGSADPGVGACALGTALQAAFRVSTNNLVMSAPDVTRRYVGLTGRRPDC